MSIPSIPVVTVIDPAEYEARERQAQRDSWRAIMVRDAAERRRKANMLCRRGHDWRDQGPMFLCGDDPFVEFWRECSRCRMTLHERPGRAPHRKRLAR